MFRMKLFLPVAIIALAGLSTQAFAQSKVSGTITDITTATNSPVSVTGNGSEGRIGGTQMDKSTVNGTITDITTATNSPVSVIGNNSIGRIGGNIIESSTVNGTVTSITTATNSPVS